MTLLTNHRSIKSQVIIYMVIGIVLMTMLIGVITAYSVNKLIRSVMLENASQISEGLARRAVFPVLSGSEENAAEAMAQVEGFQSVLAARLTLKNGKDIFSTMIKDGEILSREVNDLFLTAEYRKQSDKQIIKDTNRYWLISTPITLVTNSYEEENEFELIEPGELSGSQLQEEIIGYAEIIYNKKTLKSTQERIVGIIFSVGVISVIILSLLLHIGFIRLFEPLQKLVKNMQSTTQTGSYTQAEIRGAKEIRVIASAYNKMIGALHHQEKALVRHRDQLENEVEIRTKEFQEARDAAILASQHKTEFIANMSHELRTPIQSIIGYGELIAEEIELDGDPALLDDVDKIMSNSTRLLGMINSLLDLAKIESGHMDVHTSQFSLDELISSVCNIVEPLVTKNQNNFSLELDESIGLLYSDKQKLEHILINFLSNACKFTSKGVVTLKVYKHNSSILFEVKDSGIGLTEEQQQYIFDEFRQVDSGNARLFGGTGLGLSICKKFAELLGGTIAVSSVLNHGSTFTLEISDQK